MPFSVGDKLGPYEILAPIGAGGMGEVWKARDTRLNRIVAIKRLKAQHSARFEQEAHANRLVVETTSRTVMIGLQTHRRVRLKVKGTLESFCIAFQPGGLFRLFSMPLHELTDHDYDACAVLGPWVSRLQERLGNCDSFQERARISDECLRYFLQVRTHTDGVSAAANKILFQHSEASIPDLANRAGLSLRQFERRFHYQIGMRPKLYSRIARFEAALDSKARSRTKSWTEIAHEFGYYDQMHLVHDFWQFSGETPTNLLTELERAHRAFIDAVRLGSAHADDRDAARLFL